MGLLNLTAIPTDFGSGGSHLNPTSGTPTLQALLQEHHDALNTLDNAVGGTLDTTQTVWYWDPSNVSGLASDNNDGATSATPLLTRDAFHLRTLGRRILEPNITNQQLTLNLMSDCGDNDILTASFEPEPRTVTELVIQGAYTVQAVGVITVATTFSASGNTGNVITVPGFDFSSHVGRILRLTGTTGVGATVATIEQAVSLGVARLSEMWANDAPDTAGGFSVGQTVEILICPKLSGIHVRSAAVGINNCKIDRNVSAGSITLAVDSSRSTLSLTQCEMRGPIQSSGLQNSVYAGQFSLNGGSIVGSTWLFYQASFNTIGGAMINARIYLGNTDLVHHLADFGGTNSQIYCYDYAPVRLHSSFHMFNLAANGVGIALRYGAQVYLAAYYYGTGNDSTSAAICMTGNTRFMVQSGIASLICDAGKGLVIDANDEPTVANNGGTSVSFSSMGTQGYPTTPGTLTPRLSALLVA